jgi:hypothetical protein
LERGSLSCISDDRRHSDDCVSVMTTSVMTSTVMTVSVMTDTVMTVSVTTADTFGTASRDEA